MEKQDHLIIYPYGTTGKGVVILIPMIDSGLSLEEMQEKDVPKGRPSKIIPYTDLPKDHIFRNAWEADCIDYQGVTVNMEAAREITQENIRNERRGFFELLDAEYMKAFESQDTEKMTEIAEKKQVLRDLPASPAIENAQTPEELSELAKSVAENLKKLTG